MALLQRSETQQWQKKQAPTSNPETKSGEFFRHHQEQLFPQPLRLRVWISSSTNWNSVCQPACIFPLSPPHTEYNYRPSAPAHLLTIHSETWQEGPLFQREGRGLSTSAALCQGWWRWTLFRWFQRGGHKLKLILNNDPHPTFNVKLNKQLHSV